MKEHDLPDYYKDFFLDSGDAVPLDCPGFSPMLVDAAERRLGYRLPESFVRLMRVRNGGYLTRPIYPTDVPTAWAEDHVYIDKIFGLGGEDGIDAAKGSRTLISQWEYPDVGIVFSSNGPTAFMLDYTECGPTGEPRVVYVDVENMGEERLVLAPDFETFISRLVAFE